MEHEKIDLSPLDPSRDAARWDRLAESIAARAVIAAREVSAARRASFTRQLLAWARPALVFALVVALAAVTGAALLGEKITAANDLNEEPAFALTSWAAGGQIPSTAAILGVLGGNNGPE